MSRVVFVLLLCVGLLPSALFAQVAQTAAGATAGRAQLGIAMRNLPAPVPGADAGVIVGEVMAGSAAEQAGLRAGDVIVQIQGAPLKAASELKERIEALPIGEALSGEYVRDGVRHHFQTQLKAAITADPAIWGVYARMVGRSWRSQLDSSVRWSVPGQEMVETVTVGRYMSRAGQSVYEMRIVPGEPSGRLVGHIAQAGDFQGEYNGKLGADGSVRWQQKKGFFATAGHYVKLTPADDGGIRVSGSHMIHSTNIIGELTLYADDMRTAPDRAQWGVLADMAGRYWMAEYDHGRVRQLHYYDWRVPGLVLAHWIGDLGDGYREVQDVMLQADGSLLARVRGATEYGVAESDGSVRFKGKNRLTGDWNYVPQSDDSVAYSGDALLSSQQTIRFIPQEKENAERMIAAAAEARQQRQIAKEESRSENSALLGAIAMGAIQGASQARSEYQADRAQQDAFLAETARQAEAAAEATRQQRLQQQTQQAESTPVVSSPLPASPSPVAASTSRTSVPSASTEAGFPSSSPQPAPVTVKTLRFWLSVGMTGLPGDTRNVYCRSNIITRPGFPGWGTAYASRELALAEGEKLKPAFLAKCRQSGHGREVASPDFQVVPNDNSDEGFDRWFNGLNGDGKDVEVMLD